MRRTPLLFLILFLAAAWCRADGFTSKTQCQGFWRYNFEYVTTDIDGHTPLRLSAAVFLSNAVHERRRVAHGCALLNHYTITDEAEAPTRVTSLLSMEGVLSASDYAVIESDGLGFGLTRGRKQAYLLGEVSARHDIDALVEGRRLLEAEGFTVGRVTANLGYSQGGHTTMWVNRLLAEGYRQADVPRVDVCVTGGGPYDIPATYLDMLSRGTRYPVAVPLVLYGLVAEGECGVGESDVFSPVLAARLAGWFDSKLLATDQINDSIYALVGGNAREGVSAAALLSRAMTDTASSVSRRVVERMRAHSLVYDAWKPSATASVAFVHSPNDEVVPYLNQESMSAYLDQAGYSDYTVDTNSVVGHSATGNYYALKAFAALQRATGVVPPCVSASPSPVTVYDLGGRVVRDAAEPGTALDGLPSGIYVVGGAKYVHY